MTPKEKAKELYDYFLPMVRGSHLWDTYHNKAKQCALFVVDEIIKSLADVLLPHPFRMYWKEVKQEIENL
jgi:hypothetical protein